MINGVINIYKPQNISSNQVVIRVKKILGIKKVGHTGTLDPLACGVLPICIGNATKISEYLINKDKTYRVKVKFGILTDTYDCEGSIIKEDLDVKLIKEKVEQTLKSFIGRQSQVPPNYSALKINGVRAYELARKGVEFEIKPREIDIYSIDDIIFENNECSFVVECSKGTYIRSLCKDIAERLGTFGTMTFLERISSGQFVKSNAININDLDEEGVRKNIVSIDNVLNLPKLLINNPNMIKLLRNGVFVKNPIYIGSINKGLYLLYNGDELVGICERKADFLRVFKFLS